MNCLGDLFMLCVVLAFLILLFWRFHLNRIAVSYLLNPENEVEILKQAYYDQSWKKEYLKKLREVRIRFRMDHWLLDETEQQYLELLIEKIESDFYLQILVEKRVEE